MELAGDVEEQAEAVRRVSSFAFCRFPFWLSHLAWRAAQPSIKTSRGRHQTEARKRRSEPARGRYLLVLSSVKASNFCAVDHPEINLQGLYESYRMTPASMYARDLVRIEGYSDPPFLLVGRLERSVPRQYFLDPWCKLNAFSIWEGV